LHDARVAVDSIIRRPPQVIRNPRDLLRHVLPESTTRHDLGRPGEIRSIQLRQPRFRQRVTRLMQSIGKPRFSLLGLQIAMPRRMKYFIAWMLGVPGGLIVLWFLANQIGC
jgi:hypothetical protein